MLSLKFDSAGSQKIKWPSSDVAIIETARKLINAESALPDSQCFPRLNLLRHTRADAENAVGVIAVDGSDDMLDEDAAFSLAEDFIRIITAGLTYFHAHELECLVDWGIILIDGRPQAPSAKPAMLEMLQKYVGKESSLPCPERLPSPPLDQVTAVSTALVTAQKNREQAREKKSTKGRCPEVQSLFDLLQLAVAFHVVTNFDGVVDEQLEQLGFEVTRIPPKKPKQLPAQKPEIASPEPAVQSEPVDTEAIPDAIDSDGNDDNDDESVVSEPNPGDTTGE